MGFYLKTHVLVVISISVIQIVWSHRVLATDGQLALKNTTSNSNSSELATEESVKRPTFLTLPEPIIITSESQKMSKKLKTKSSTKPLTRFINSAKLGSQSAGSSSSQSTGSGGYGGSQSGGYSAPQSSGGYSAPQSSGGYGQSSGGYGSGNSQQTIKYIPIPIYMGGQPMSMGMGYGMSDMSSMSGMSGMSGGMDVDTMAAIMTMNAANSGYDTSGGGYGSTTAAPQYNTGGYGSTQAPYGTTQASYDTTQASYGTSSTMTYNDDNSGYDGGNNNGGYQNNGNKQTKNNKKQGKQQGGYQKGGSPIYNGAGNVMNSPYAGMSMAVPVPGGGNSYGVTTSGYGGSSQSGNTDYSKHLVMITNLKKSYQSSSGSQSSTTISTTTPPCDGNDWDDNDGQGLGVTDDGSDQDNNNNMDDGIDGIGSNDNNTNGDTTSNGNLDDNDFTVTQEDVSKAKQIARMLSMLSQMTD